MAAGPLPLPVFFEFAAPADWHAIDLISDLHLSNATTQTFDAWSEHLRHTDADAVFILGDLFELWLGDDACGLPFEQRCVDVLCEASTRLQLGFMAGNRDFLVGVAMLRDCGVMALPDPTVLVACGERLLLTHGDALCLEDTAYQQFRAEVRTAHWREAFLARPLAERRELASQMREASQRHQRDQQPENWADLDIGTTVQWMHEAGTPVMVHGHTHRPGTQELAPGFTRAVLSDWDLDTRSARAEVLRLSLHGLERVAPARAD